MLLLFWLHQLASTLLIWSWYASSKAAEVLHVTVEFISHSFTLFQGDTNAFCLNQSNDDTFLNTSCRNTVAIFEVY